MHAPCPVCRDPAHPPSTNPAAPFCSERCRLLDLSAWLGERYAIPGEPVDPNSDGEPDQPEPPH